MENPEDRFEEVSIEAWDMAVYHAERAYNTFVDISEVLKLGQKVIEEHKTMAAYYLALGGFGNDVAAYRELGLPFYQGETSEDNIVIIEEAEEEEHWDDEEGF